jgi:hypothetical protein
MTLMSSVRTCIGIMTEFFDQKGDNRISTGRFNETEENSFSAPELFHIKRDVFPVVIFSTFWRRLSSWYLMDENLTHAERKAKTAFADQKKSDQKPAALSF